MGAEHEPRLDERTAWFGAQHEQLREPLLRFLRGLAGQDADDLAAQVWLEAFEQLDVLEPDATRFRRLLFTIARRRVIDHRRRWWQRRVVPCADVTDSADVAHVSTDQAIAVIRQLPRGQAEVVLLRVVGGFSATEVASITGRSPGAVRVLQHRALTRLAGMIDQNWGWE